MRTFVAAVVLVAILAGPACAQMGGINAAPTLNTHDREEAARAEQERAAIEKEYNETMKRNRSASVRDKRRPIPFHPKDQTFWHHPLLNGRMPVERVIQASTRKVLERTSSRSRRQIAQSGMKLKKR